MQGKVSEMNRIVVETRRVNQIYIILFWRCLFFKNRKKIRYLKSELR